MGYLLILLGLVVLGVALAALIRGHLGWARIPHRKTAVVTLILGVLVVGAGGALTPQPPSGTTANTAISTARSAPSATSTITTTATTANPSSTTPAAGGTHTAAAPGLPDTSVWDTLAQCESSGNWATNTGNGLYGGVQLDQSAWLSNGGGAYAPLPSEATREQQIVIAEKVRADHGFTPWSGCADKLGLR